MADMQISQQQLTQALAQLQKASASSDLAKVGVEVLVRYISANQLQLSQTNQQRTQLPLILQLPQSKSPAQIATGKYQANISQQQGQPILSLFASSAETTSNININQQQTKQLLSLPPHILFDNQNKPLIPIKAAVTRVATNNIEVSFSLNGQPQKAQIASAQAQNFSVGQNVTVQLVPIGNDYQVKLLTQTQQKAQTSGDKPVVGNKSEQVNFAQVPAANTQSRTSPAQIAITSQLSTLQAAPLLQASLRLEQTPRIQLDSKSLLAAVTTLPLQQQQALLPLLQKLTPFSSADVKITHNGNAQIQGLAATPSPASTAAIQLPMQPKQVEQLKALNIPVLDKALQSKPPMQAEHLTTKALAADKAVIQHQLLPPSTAPQSQPVKLANNIVESIQSLIRQRLPAAESPTQSLQKIDLALTDPQVPKSPELKQLIEQLQPRLAQLKPQGEAVDANRIQQLVSAPFNAVGAAALTSPAPANNLVNGLITVLQLALSARVARGSNAAFERVQAAITQLIPTLLTSATPQTTRRTLQDFSQLEQKHQLLREIGRFLAGHQLHKLNSAEQTAQGQETLYYVLPNAMGSNNKDIELLIKREPEKQGSEKQHKAANKIWDLTMKLSVGDLGELLSKAKLQETSLDLSLYASNETLKTKVFEYLPLLKKRFEQLGINVTKSSCQLGRIPDSLQQRPYQIFQTQA